MKATNVRFASSLALRFAVLFTLAPLSLAGTWVTLNNAPPTTVSSTLLLTDGTVMVQGESNGLGTSNWYRLIPDINGSYQNGTWTQIASMPSGYAPRFYGSAVLPDGRVIVEGGEYNGSSGTPVETNLGAIYNPATNTWTMVTPPVGWSQIGDAASVVLSNGTFMLSSCCTSNQALLDPTNLTWSFVGSGKSDSNNEEGLTLLPNGKVLTVDIWNTRNTELYNPSTQSWASAGLVPSSLVNLCETGPAVLRPNGTVIAFGATGATAVYNTGTGTWSAGPSLPSGWVSSDAPAAVLPSGNVLVGVSGPYTGTCTNPTIPDHISFTEFNGSTYTTPNHAIGSKAFRARFLVLPTGNILYTHDSSDVQIYMPTGTYQAAWQPTINSVNTTLAAGSLNNLVTGTQFNGLSQGAMFGDDYQSATNYPLVQIKNTSTGHVFYCKTHNHSSMGVATGSASVNTEFDIPSNIETGAATLVVIANGIPSNPLSITVTPGALSCTPSFSCAAHPGNVIAGGITLTCNQPTMLTASATICGIGCSTNNVAPPVPQQTISAGGSATGTSGSCSFNWTWGGNSFSQGFSAP